MEFIPAMQGGSTNECQSMYYITETDWKDKKNLKNSTYFHDTITQQTTPT